MQNSTIYGNVKTNSGAGIRGNGTTLDVYGSIVNNGTIYINFSTDTLRVWGNLIHNGSNWAISNTKIKSRSTLSGSSAYNTRILVDTSCYIDGNISVYRLEIRSGDTLYIPDVSDALTVTGADEAKIYGTIYGSGAVNFGGHVTSANTNLSTIVFNGGDQNVNGQFTAGQIIFGGSNSKTISNYAALYGNTSVNSGSSLRCLGTVLDVYGNFLNNGSLTVNYSTDSIRIWGNLTNNGSWNISNTKIKSRATITGTNEYYTRLWLDTSCTIDGNVSIRQLEIPAGDTLYIPDPSDGLTVVYSVNSTINGAIYGTGTVAFQGHVASASTTASAISFTGGSQNIGGMYTADQITFAGSSSKNFNNISLFGNVVINSGVILYGLGATMNVFGDVLNNGLINNNYSTDSIRVWGNMTNNGNWTIASTKIKSVATISGSGAYNTRFYVDTHCSISGKAQIQHLQIIAGNTVNIPTAGDTLVVTGNAVAETGGQTAGNGLLIFGGGSQTFSGVYGASNILFSGSGTKSFQNSSLYGNAVVNNSILLQGVGTTLNVYGSMTNNGTLVNNYSTDSIRIWGDVSNYNAWNIAHTKIKSIATVTGSSLYNTRFWADTNCYIHGKVQILRLEVSAGDTVFLPEETDTLVTTGDGTTILGLVHGNGKVYYNAGVTSSQTIVSELFFSGGSQAIGGAFTAQQITFGGSGSKSLGNTSLYGNAVIQSGVNVL